MNKQIYLDDKATDFALSDLPLLIHGADGSGASLFSITMAANFFRQGFKILFMSGYYMARDEFREQTLVEDSILLENAAMVSDALHRRVVFIAKEHPELFLEIMNRTANADGWIIFLKNIELLDDAILERVLTVKNIILAGNFDRCSADLRTYIDTAPTKIVFTNSSKIPGLSISDLPKYSGLLLGATRTGYVIVR